MLTLDATFACFRAYENKTMNKKYHKALGATYGQRAVQLLSVTLVLIHCDDPREKFMSKFCEKVIF